MFKQFVDILKDILAMCPECNNIMEEQEKDSYFLSCSKCGCIKKKDFITTTIEAFRGVKNLSKSIEENEKRNIETKLLTQ